MLLETLVGFVFLIYFFVVIFCMVAELEGTLKYEKKFIRVIFRIFGYQGFIFFIGFGLFFLALLSKTIGKFFIGLVP